MQLKEAAKNVKLHAIKCYNIAARGIKNLAYSKELNKLGVVRNDFSIEVWNLTNAPFLERTISGSWQNTVEAICWAGSRLFSVGLSGDGLKEWDLKTLTVKRRQLLTGDKGICMDYHQASETLVVGTEEGIINVFDLSEDDLQFVRVLDRQDHRIICCKFSDAGDKLVSGSLDSVKVWNIQTGQVIHKMSTGRAEHKQETIVWCIEVLNDFTIVSGDSRGRVTFWDGNVGSQIDYVHASPADIMCLAVSEDRKSFFCSGVEQILKKYTRVVMSKAGEDIEQWVKCAKRSNIHTHDVYAMVTIGNDRMISGGVDGFLSFAGQDFKRFHRVGPFLKKPFAETAEEGRLMLMKYVNYLEIWKLAGAKELEDDRKNCDEAQSDDEIVPQLPSTAKTNQLYRINDFPEKFLELRSKNDEMIVCCAISNDGHWIAYSTMTNIRVFQFHVQDKSKPQLKLIKSTPVVLTPCNNMTFSKDSSTLITVKNDGHCSVFDLESEIVEHKESFDVSEYHSDLIHQIAISNCSKYLVLSSLCNNITVWNLKRNKWTHAKTLPKYSCPSTSLSIRKNSPNLLISYSDNKILEYNLDEHAIQFSAILPTKSEVVDSLVTDICLDPRNPDAIIFARDNAIQVITKNKESNPSKKAKTTQISSKYEVKVVKSVNTHLIHLEFLGEDELLSLEMNPVTLSENLPQPLKRKIFGMT